MMPSPLNVIAYSVQFGVLVMAALLITHALRLRAPLPSLRFWQAILAASLLLPLVQPRVGDADVVIASAALASIASRTSIDAVSLGDRAIGQWLLPVVVTGIAIRLLWLGIGVMRLRGIIRGATVDRSLDPLLRELTSALQTHATVAISDAIESPATVGLRRPLILLPRRVLDMPVAVQRAAIAHELVHVRRRDWLHTMAEEIWCALLWFHPAARLIASRLSMARETFVDQTTILLTRDRRAYAEALLAFANLQPGALTTHLPGITPLIGRRHLSQRISLIAEEEIMSRRRIVASLVIALAISTAATVSAAVTFPMTGTQSETKVYKPGDGVSAPSVIHEVKPVYPREVMQRKVQGSVWMAVVVLASGDVGDVRISKALDPDLDQEAIKAMKQWKFRPGTKDGKPVAVEVTVEMTFTLK